MSRTDVPEWVRQLPFHVAKRESPNHLWLVQVYCRADTKGSFPVELGQVPYCSDWTCNGHGGEGAVVVIGRALQRIHRDYLDQLDYDPSQAQRITLAHDYAQAVKILATMYDTAVIQDTLEKCP